MEQCFPKLRPMLKWLPLSHFLVDLTDAVFCRLYKLLGDFLPCASHSVLLHCSNYFPPKIQTIFFPVKFHKVAIRASTQRAEFVYAVTFAFAAIVVATLLPTQPNVRLHLPTGLPNRQKCVWLKTTATSSPTSDIVLIHDEIPRIPWTTLSHNLPKRKMTEIASRMDESSAIGHWTYLWNTP